jgi:succinate dehydrogenase/fumarate reductase cytochrome b subunit (b558 family)
MAADLAEAKRERLTFLLRRLHSLSGALPLGGFLVLHTWTSAHALSGRAAYDQAVLARYDWPLLVLLEFLFVYFPLAFHAGYGVKIILEGRPNPLRYRFAKNWGHMMQRVTGLVALLFIVMHVWQFRVPLLLGKLEATDLFSEQCASLSSTLWGGVPVNAAATLIGVAACAFHFSNGLYGFCFSWGITPSERGARALGTVFGLMGLFLFAYGALTVIYFATGSAPTWLGARGAEGAVVCENGGTLSAYKDSARGARATERTLGASPNAALKP